MEGSSAAAPASPATTAPSGGTSPSASAPPPNRRRTLMIVAAAVVVVVILVLVLLLAAVVHTGSGGSNVATVAAYSSAATSANSVSNSASGGPWSLLVVEGAALVSGYSNSSGPNGCAIRGGTGMISFAAFSGNYSSGKLPDWLFVYGNTAMSSLLAVEVSSGSATEVGTLQGSSCTSDFGFLSAIPSNVVDSTQVATALLSETAVETFLSTYASANAQYVLADASGSADWEVEYSTCPLVGPSGSGTGASVMAEVNAVSGTVTAINSAPAGTSCSGTTHSSSPIGTAFTAGNPVARTCPSGGTVATTGCIAGDYTYTLTVESSAVNFSSVLFKVDTSTGAVFTNTGEASFALMNISGGIAAYSTFSAGAGLFMPTTWANYQGTATAATPLTNLYTIVIDIGQSASTAGQGLTFVVVGTGAYSGTTSPVTLP